MAVSNAKREWNDRYDKEHMALISIKCPKEEKALCLAEAEKYGIKLASYVRACVKYCIENDIDIKKSYLLGRTDNPDINK